MTTRRSARNATTGSVWIVRHGERADQADDEWWRRASRPHDPPLTDRGFQQAAAAAEALNGAKVDAIYSSPFLRCVQTASEISRRHGLKIRIEPGFCELLHAEWFDFEGHECATPRSGMPVDAAMSASALAELFGKDVIDTTYTPFFDAVERGRVSKSVSEKLKFPEAWEEGFARYVQALSLVRSLSAFAVIVTHGAGVQACGESCEGIDMEHMDVDYCCLTELRRRGNVDKWIPGEKLACARHTIGL